MIERISADPRYSRIQQIKAYTDEERSERLKQIELTLQEQEELRAYLAQFPNPDHLSFEELLQRDMASATGSASSVRSAEKAVDGVIIDIGNHQEDTGIIVDISSHS